MEVTDLFDVVLDPRIAHRLLVEILRDESLRSRFAERWNGAFWRPVCALFKRLQRDGKLRSDLPVDALARMFLSLNLGFLIGRFVLAPALHWNEAQEIDAIVQLFAAGAAGKAG